MIVKPRAAAIKIIAVYWTLLILGMVTYSSLRLDAFTQLEPVWTGAIGGSVLGQLLAGKRYRTWLAMMLVLAVALLLLPQMPHELGGKRLWLSFLPAALCGYWSLGDRTSLAAFWFPAMIWMLSILDGTHANALPGREGLVLFAALTALFVVYLRVREERRVALWQTVAPEPIAVAKPAVIVQDRTAAQLASGAWGLLVTGLGFGVTAWLAPLLWQPEVNAGGHSTARTLDVAYDTATASYTATREHQREVARRRASTYRPAYDSPGSYYVTGSYDGSYTLTGSTDATVASGGDSGAMPYPDREPPKLPCCPIEDDVYTKHVRVKEFLALGRSDEEVEHKPKFACRPCTYAERYPAPAPSYADVDTGADDMASGTVVGDGPYGVVIGRGDAIGGGVVEGEAAGGGVVGGDMFGDRDPDDGDSVGGGGVVGGGVVGGGTVGGGAVGGGAVGGGAVGGGAVGGGAVAAADYGAVDAARDRADGDRDNSAVRHDDVRRDDVRRDDVRHDDVRRDDVRHDDVRRDDVRHDDVRRDDVRRDDVRRDDVRRVDVRRDDVRRDDVRRDDVRRDDVRRDDVRRDDVRRDARSATTNPSATNPSTTPSAATTPTPSTVTPSAATSPTPSAATTPTPSAATTPTPSAATTPTPSTAATPTPSAATTPTPSAATTPTPSAATTPTAAGTSTKSDSDTVASRPADDSSSSFLHWLVLLTASLFATQLIALVLRPIRRAIALRHLRRPYWQETVDQRISNAWQLVLVGLRDAGWRADSTESPRELARRVGIDGVERCATILDRARHGIRIDREDLADMTSTADEAYRDARKQVRGVGRATSWLRWPLV